MESLETSKLEDNQEDSSVKSTNEQLDSAIANAEAAGLFS